MYPTASWEEMINIFQTSKDGIIHKAKQLGIKREMVNFAKYTSEEISYIKANYKKIPNKFIAEQLGRTTCAIETKAKKLKLGTRTYWTDEEIDLLKKVFPLYDNQELSEIYFENRTPIAIDGMAQKLGLTKKDFPHQKQKQYNRETLLQDIKNIYYKLGRTPLLTELRLYGLPSERTMLRYFPEGYSGICKQLGMPENHRCFGKSNAYYSKNGDICLSIVELVITDFLIDNNIKYYKEELYRDVFNIQEFGTKRIDWRLNNNIVIEYFGMMNNEEYKKSALEKINLCKKYNINLIELYPENIKDLKNILEPYIK